MELTLYGEGEGVRASERDVAALAAEFPTLKVEAYDCEAPPGALRAERWRAPGFDFWAFDHRADDLAAAGRPLPVAGPWAELPRLALEVAGRCQRLFGRRNGASAGTLFDRALVRHRALHDLAQPLAQADYDHSLDVWQWALRLDPDASLAVQLAALFHDVERLAPMNPATPATPETPAIIERREPATGYGDFKEAHARGSARLAGELLAELGAGEPLCRRIEALIAGHERPAGGSDAERSLLADADALSFFSLNSPGYADWFGPEAARRKVAWTLARLSPCGRRRLAAVGLRQDVAAMLREARASA
jgi:uncharacterized protein DUF4202